ncbi:hypothetical protein F5876DRAFT_76661 [Lentinula aff. lateritia]|uniref:Uncharacterized protein n=1 Tax=Lentinula aff. lateritia TaxID=2804960 RepID=A0ACC1U0I1_9AGAR|nr:hypothetical protein F5876DRAFT_76661 [Lentinula aff. lateritia]
MAEASNSSSNMVNNMHSDPELGPRIANMLFETVQEKRKRVRELEAKCEELVNLGKLQAAQETSIQSISAELREMKATNTNLEKEVTTVKRRKKEIILENDALEKERDALLKKKEELERKLGDSQHRVIVKAEPSGPNIHTSGSINAKYPPKAPRAYKVLSPASTSQAAYSEVRDQNIILNEVNNSLNKELKNKEIELKQIGHRLAEAEASKEVIAEKLKSEQSTYSSLKEKYELLKDSFEEQKQELEKKAGLNRYYSIPHCSRELFRQTAAENTTLIVEKERLEVQTASNYKASEAALAVEQAKNQELLAERTKHKDQAALQVEMFCTTCKAKENIMWMEGKSTQIKQEQIHDRIEGSNDTTSQQSKIQRLEEELQLVTEKFSEADNRAKLYQEKYKHMVMEKKALENCNDLHLQAPTPIPELTGYRPLCPADAPPINNYSRPRSHSLPLSESVAVPGITLAQPYSTFPAPAQSHISQTDAVGQASSPIDASVSPPPRIAEPMTDPDGVNGLRDMSQSPECIAQGNLLQTVISTVSDLPQCMQLRDGKERRPFAPRSSKLLDCLRDAAPMYHWRVKRSFLVFNRGPGAIFFLPGRLLKAGSQHYVVVEPASQLIPNTGHRIHSRIGDYIGQTRDLFVTDNEWIFYAGSYKLLKIGKAPSAAFKFSDFHDIVRFPF